LNTFFEESLNIFIPVYLLERYCWYRKPT